MPNRGAQPDRNSKTVFYKPREALIYFTTMHTVSWTQSFFDRLGGIYMYGSGLQTPADVVFNDTSPSLWMGRFLFMSW